MAPLDFNSWILVYTPFHFQHFSDPWDINLVNKIRVFVEAYEQKPKMRLGATLPGYLNSRGESWIPAARHGKLLPISTKEKWKGQSNEQEQINHAFHQRSHCLGPKRTSVHLTVRYRSHLRR